MINQFKIIFVCWTILGIAKLLPIPSVSLREPPEQPTTSLSSQMNWVLTFGIVPTIPVSSSKLITPIGEVYTKPLQLVEDLCVLRQLGNNESLWTSPTTKVYPTKEGFYLDYSSKFYDSSR